MGVFCKMKNQLEEKIKIVENTVDNYIDRGIESFFPMDSPQRVPKEKVLTDSDDEQDDKDELEEMLNVLRNLKSG